MTRIQGIIFDKDGTLFAFNDTWAQWSVTFLTSLAPNDDALRRSMADKVGFDWDAKTFKAGSLAVNAAVDEQCILLASVHPELDAKQIERLAFDALQDSNATPVCDLHGLLGGLRDTGFRLGVATNDFENSAHTQMRDAKIDHHFEFICGFDSGHGSKPGAGIITAFCAQMNLDPAHVAMVGDSTHDLEAGRSAGVGLNVGVLTGPARMQDIEHLADVILPDISGLPAILSAA